VGPSNDRLLRTSGEVYVGTSYVSAKYRLRWLKVPGSGEAVPLDQLDWSEVQEACLANGWRFVDPPAL